MVHGAQWPVGGETERSRLNPSHLSLPAALGAAERHSQANCCGLPCQTMAFPQHHKACAKEKGEARGCFQMLRHTPFRKHRNLASSCRHAWEDEDNVHRPTRSCVLWAAPDSSRIALCPQAPVPGQPPHSQAIVLLPWEKRSSLCPGRGQIADFCSFNS